MAARLDFSLVDGETLARDECALSDVAVFLCDPFGGPVFDYLHSSASRQSRR